MLSARKIIEEAELLPVEQRAMIVEGILETLNPVDETIQKEWLKVAKKRYAEIKSGKERTIPADEVLERIHKRFSK